MRTTVFDIETTDLAANFGRLLCCSFIDVVPGVPNLPKFTTTFRRDYKKWQGGKLTDDRKLAIAIRDRLEDADIIVGWNSILFDVPFVNTRLAAYGERPIQVGEKYGSHHIDLMYYAGGQSLRLGSRRLDVVTKFFGTTPKTPLTAEIWAEASVGDKEAMKQVVEHCEADVCATADVFPKLAPFVKKVQFNLSQVYPFLKDIPSTRPVI